MESSPPVNPDRRARYALAAVWLIAAWVLAGAVFKLGWGTPALLPAGVRASYDRLSAVQRAALRAFLMSL